jgi:hypothetical protein
MYSFLKNSILLLPFFKHFQASTSGEAILKRLDNTEVKEFCPLERRILRIILMFGRRTARRYASGYAGFRFFVDKTG